MLLPFNFNGPSPTSTRPEADTSNCGIPDLSLTVNNVPSKSSSNENIVPSDPITSNIVEPDPSTVNATSEFELDIIADPVVANEPDTVNVALGVLVPKPN